MFGIGVSPGISIGKAFLPEKKVIAPSGTFLQGPEAITGEIEKFDKAVRTSIEEIEAIKAGKKNILQQEELDILDSQIEFLSDPQIRTDVLEKINTEHRTAVDAVLEAINSAAGLFRDIEDEYLKARAADINDAGIRIMKNLDAGGKHLSAEIPENSIIIAGDISPSDLLSYDLEKITGIATRSGGRTSHTAIIARSRGIPAVVACGEGLMQIRNNDTVIVDGTSGEVIIRPGNETVKKYKTRQKKYTEEIIFLKGLKEIPSITPDGQKISLFANISNADDLKEVFDNGGEGVGLLRSELLFMGRESLPGEEEQFRFYREVAVRSNNAPVIIRTLDIGGDKQLPYFAIPHENNPFLGYRALRLCLDQSEIFLTQLKAILRASAFGQLKIMFPMVTNVTEVKRAREITEEAKQSLRSLGIEFNNEIELGIMIEIPSAALTADILAKEVDFFSIGTNDLCQYTLAVDRMNERVSYLYDHFDPAVLRLIYYVIDQAQRHNIHAGLCGEMASDPLATLLLMGMGLKEFSMGAASISAVKKVILSTNISKARDIFEKIKLMESAGEIRNYLMEVSS